MNLRTPFAVDDDVEKVAGRIRGASQQLRIAAPSIVLHDYVPELLRRVRRRFPTFRLQLHEAARAGAERVLQAGEIVNSIWHVVHGRRNAAVLRDIIEELEVMNVHDRIIRC